MKYLFELTHPKHYHQFKYIIKSLSASGNIVKIVARDKDSILDLLKKDFIDYEIYGKHGKNIWGKFTFIPNIISAYTKIIKSFKPDVVVSKASPYAAILSRIFGIKTVIFPDSEVVTLTNKFVAPLSSIIVTPDTYKLDFGKKHKRIQGLFECCYLHHKYFTPDKSSLKYLPLNGHDKYIVLRFVGWNANHDISQKGFSLDEKIKLVKILSNYAKVFISSENSLPPELSEYKLNIPPNKIHDILYYANMYIGDSQTMATEAALLGTPALRSNSFVGEGDMSNFKLLEHNFDLLYNFKNFDNLIKKSLELINDPESKSKWQMKKEIYFETIGDLNESIYQLLLKI